MALAIVVATAFSPSELAAAHWWEAGPPLPRLSGRVVDAADLLSLAEEERLSVRLAQVEKQTRHQFVIVTVRSLDGQTIEDFGIRLGRTWEIGRKNVNDGVLLIVAPNERKVRIEVGDGLEHELPDEICAAIIRQRIIPAFRDGRFAMGIDAGATAIIARLTSGR